MLALVNAMATAVAMTIIATKAFGNDSNSNNSNYSNNNDNNDIKDNRNSSNSSKKKSLVACAPSKQSATMTRIAVIMQPVASGSIFENAAFHLFHFEFLCCKCVCLLQQLLIFARTTSFSSEKLAEHSVCAIHSVISGDFIEGSCGEACMSQGNH